IPSPLMGLSLPTNWVKGWGKQEPALMKIKDKPRRARRTRRKKYLFYNSSCPSCSSWFLKDVGKDKPIKGGETLMPTLSGQKEMKLNP
ncbi:MAG: hypothetical protein AB1797_07315, partial [bacterium]